MYAKMCPVCNGKGYNPCRHCNGGFVPPERVEFCRECKGKNMETCSRCKGEGSIPVKTVREVGR